MFREKKVNRIIKFKQIYLLFIFLISFSPNLFPQVSLDSNSVVLVRQDIIDKDIAKRDSIKFQYIAVNTGFNHHYLDSIKALVIVDNNDFVSWMDAMNKLSTQHQEYSKIVPVLKSQRPIWILAVVLLLFISIGLVRIFFFINFNNILYGFYNDRVLVQINREDSIATSWPYIFLYTIFTLTLGLLVTMYRSYVLHLGEIEFVMFLKISVGIALLFLIKIIIVRFVGILFQVEKFVREYVVFLYLFYFNSVLILMPLLLLVTFTSLVYFNYLLILFLLVVVILFFYRFLRIMSSLIDGLRFSIFYLILYLCTLEIAPILILVKSLNN